MVDTVKESNVYPVNSNGEILLQRGTGDLVVAGYISSLSVPKHYQTDKMVVMFPEDMPLTIVSSAAPVDGDGMPNGTIYIQTA